MPFASTSLECPARYSISRPDVTNARVERRRGRTYPGPLVVGTGINGVGIARDAAERGLSVT